MAVDHLPFGRDDIITNNVALTSALSVAVFGVSIDGQEGFVSGGLFRSENMGYWKTFDSLKSSLNELIIRSIGRLMSDTNLDKSQPIHVYAQAMSFYIPSQILFEIKVDDPTTQSDVSFSLEMWEDGNYHIPESVYSMFEFVPSYVVFVPVEGIGWLRADFWDHDGTRPDFPRDTRLPNTPDSAEFEVASKASSPFFFGLEGFTFIPDFIDSRTNFFSVEYTIASSAGIEKFDKFGNKIGLNKVRVEIEAESLSANQKGVGNVILANAEPGRMFTIESSYDLSTWIPLGVLVCEYYVEEKAKLEVDFHALTSASPSGAVFFRAVEGIH